MLANAESGIWCGCAEPLVLFGVVVVAVVVLSAVPGAESAPDDGVYCTLLVSAAEPAEAELEEEKFDVAPEPVAPDEAFAWM